MIVAAVCGKNELKCVEEEEACLLCYCLLVAAELNEERNAECVSRLWIIASLLRTIFFSQRSLVVLKFIKDQWFAARETAKTYHPYLTVLDPHGSSPWFLELGPSAWRFHLEIDLGWGSCVHALERNALSCQPFWSWISCMPLFISVFHSPWLCKWLILCMTGIWVSGLCFVVAVVIGWQWCSGWLQVRPGWRQWCAVHPLPHGETGAVRDRLLRPPSQALPTGSLLLASWAPALLSLLGKATCGAELEQPVRRSSFHNCGVDLLFLGQKAMPTLAKRISDS